MLKQILHGNDVLKGEKDIKQLITKVLINIMMFFKKGFISKTMG